jgi:methenyltetrahydromethanopterin cyclohydrolase
VELHFMLSVNRKAYSLVQHLCTLSEEFSVTVQETESGTTLIDAGVNAKGGFNTGRIVTEICMGGLGEARISTKDYGALRLPSISIYTDHPAVATLGSQFAGWQITREDFYAIGSGPARALSLKPRDIFEKIQYRDTADVAILVLETSKTPPDALLDSFSAECGISPNQLYVILVPTTSVTGCTQVSGRIVETGLHKLSKLGIDPLSVEYASGYAPIAPVDPDFTEAMGKTNDAILYGGVAYYALKHADDNALKRLLDKAPSSASKHYGQPFKTILKEANYDFYQIDPHLFAPAVLMVNNTATGSLWRAGEINTEVLEQALDYAAI